MGLSNGFLKYSRSTGCHVPVAERIKHYNEFHSGPDESTLKEQGARCMDCGIPYCHSWGCPNANLIPEWNDLVYRGEWYQAYKRLSVTSSFPEFTGRICPAPCEPSCTLSINSEPVAIKQIELAIIEKAFKEGWVKAVKPVRDNGRSVAVIGSGPAGLAAAVRLRRAGFRVTVFEKSNRIGGLLRYGIPNFKLEKWVLDRRIAIMKEEGIEFETDVNIGEDLSIRYLKRSYDALLLAMGAGKPRDIPAGGRGLEGIHFAMEYLTSSALFNHGDTEKPAIDARGKRVLVIGGGDTGSDCVGTAVRQGAARISQIEIMPKPEDWELPWNPQWPEWPSILRTSSSQEEGGVRDWGVSTRQFTGRGIQVSEAHCVRVNWEENPSNGRMRPVEVPGSEFSLPVDLVFLALGFVHVEHEGFLESLDLKCDPRGNIVIDENYETSQSGIFAAGDCHSGASLVIRAMDRGRRAADAIIGKK